MPGKARAGAVIFTANKDRLAAFYSALTSLPVRVDDETITVLASDHFELVLHALPNEPAGQPAPREDVYIKPFFPVRSLSEARATAARLGGQLRPQADEWEARGFRACEATDPDGNLIQFREEAR